MICRLTFGLGCRHCHPAGFDSDQSLPQHARGLFGGVQGCLCSFRVGGDAMLELVAPDGRMAHIGSGMKREIAARLVVGMIRLAQTAVFIL